MSVDARAAARRYQVVDLVLVLLVLGLAAGTTLVATVPTIVPAIVNDRLDVAISTAATLVSVSVAALSWARGRVAGDSAAIVRGAAFAVLAVLNGLTLVTQIVGAEALVGASLEDPGQLPLLAGVLGRGTSAGLLVLAGFLALRQGQLTIRPAVLVLGPATLLAAALLLAVPLQDGLPMLASRALLDQLASMPSAPVRVEMAIGLVTIQIVIGIGFGVAALLAHRSYRANLRTGQALLAAGLLIAAISQVHTSLHPGSYQTVVTTGDLLRLAFYVMLLAGIVVDSRDDLRELRHANLEVRRLADAELATVALEERARLAREIHDGLAQDLWYAKLKHSRLAQLAGFGAELKQLSDEIEAAIDSGLAEARNAVAAMRQGAEVGPLLDMLVRHVDDFSDRFALRAELTNDGPVPDVGPRTQAEVLRIVQEALTNVRKHADATVVRVNVAADGELRVTISDNGRGFHPETVSSGFGLESMRQRAEIIGAELEVHSEPQNGTRLELRVPLEGRREADGD